MPISYIEVMTGEETYRNATVKVYAFVCSSDKQEKHIGVAAREGTYNISQLSRQQFNAFSGLSSDLGAWNCGRYQAHDGVVLKLWGYTSRYGTPRLSGIIYLQLRAEAALQTISFPLLCVENKSRYRNATIKGNFDILTEKEVTRMRLQTKTIAKVCSVADMKPFTIATLMAEKSARPDIKVMSVTVSNAPAARSVQMAEAPRRIRLKKSKPEESAE